jgi:hypothetical protein
MTFVLSPPNDLLVFELFIVVGEMDVDSPLCAVPTKGRSPKPLCLVSTMRLAGNDMLPSIVESLK